MSFYELEQLEIWFSIKGIGILGPCLSKKKSQIMKTHFKLMLLYICPLWSSRFGSPNTIILLS